MRTVGLKLDPPKYTCPECGEGFKTKRDLTEHIRLEHPQETSPEQETEV